jgi:hypothetical protein
VSLDRADVVIDVMWKSSGGQIREQDFTGGGERALCQSNVNRIFSQTNSVPLAARSEETEGDGIIFERSESIRDMVVQEGYCRQEG